jgi:hypothetical protein
MGNFKGRRAKGMWYGAKRKNRERWGINEAGRQETEKRGEKNRGKGESGTRGNWPLANYMIRNMTEFIDVG